jgi:hypothetical protein
MSIPNEQKQEIKPAKMMNVKVAGPYRTLQGNAIPKKQAKKYKMGKHPLSK